MRFAHDAGIDPSSRFYGTVKLDGIGMAGYSLGGGRVVRAVSAIEARAQAAAQREAAPLEREQRIAASAAAAAADEIRWRVNADDAVENETGSDEEEEEEVNTMTTPEEVNTLTTKESATSASMNRAAAASARAAERRRTRTRSTRNLLGSGGDAQRCGASCEATLCRAGATLQGWNEGAGSNSSTSLLVLTADTDEVAGPWIDNQYPLFARATGRRLMGVVADGPHNLGPHYWLGFTTAFMLARSSLHSFIPPDTGTCIPFKFARLLKQAPLH